MSGFAGVGDRYDRQAVPRPSGWTRDYLRKVALADFGCAVAGVFVAAQLRFGNNAARHSGPARVSLSLQRQGSSVWLCVSGNGSGFDPAVSAGGFGLTSLRDRAGSVGGDLRISSVPGRGTEVEVTL